MEVPHPSEFIKEEMTERGWDSDDVAARMNPKDVVFNRLCVDMYLCVGPTDSNLRIGSEMAEGFARAFDVSAEYFLNLESAWLASVAH